MDNPKDSQEEVNNVAAEDAATSGTEKEGVLKSVNDAIDDAGEKVSQGFNKTVRWTKGFVRRVLIAALLIGIVALGGYMLYANYTYSEGTRSGNLIKISKKGYVFKTYEGQLKLGGIDLENPDEGLSDTWSFSVKDPAIVQKLEKLQGETVILRYKEINQSMPWQGDTEYFIVAVE